MIEPIQWPRCARYGFRRSSDRAAFDQSRCGLCDDRWCRYRLEELADVQLGTGQSQPVGMIDLAVIGVEFATAPVLGPSPQQRID